MYDELLRRSSELLPGTCGRPGGSDVEPTTSAVTIGESASGAGLPLTGDCKTPALARVLLATDGSSSSAHAAELVRSLPWGPGTALHVLAVLDLFLASRFETRQGFSGIETLVAREAAILERPGLTVKPHLRAGDADHQIVMAANELHAGLIVVGSRGMSGIEGFVLGSVARSVARHADCSVMVARPPRNGMHEVLLAVDGSASAHRAVEAVAAFPLPADAQITMVYVVHSPSPLSELVAVAENHLYAAIRERIGREERAARGILAEARRLLPERRVRTEVRMGRPAEEILNLAETLDADLIVAGARGHSLLEMLRIGSVSEAILHRAHCSVLLAR